jgi:hypothetical protein
MTWRDAPVAGPLRAEQLLVLAVLLGVGVAAALLARGAGSVEPRTAAGWPDPGSPRRA